ncbi:cobalamin-binding protein [Aliiglaciecola sp. NS0011-25]|uniref:cobalamin-binding protein n=1 Tax=Aliiglaciecola sp. NS0011-25 TaxID=3127654 RepID=UPI00310A90F7
MSFQIIKVRFINGLFALACALLSTSICLASQGTEQSLQTDKQNLKIIALAPHIVELLFDIGAGKQIIATGSYADYPEQAKTLPRVGDHSRLQIEKILKLKADIVIAWRSGNPLEDLARLEQFGIPVIYSDPKKLEDVAKELLMFGEMTGRQTVARLRADTYVMGLKKLREQYANQIPISVFFEIWSAPLQTIAGNAWPQQHLNICGAQNIFADLSNDYPSVSLEQVISKMPQVIIQPKANKQLASRLYDWQKFDFLPAVKNDFVFRPDADRLYRMTTRVLDEVQVICEQIQLARRYYQQQQS